MSTTQKTLEALSKNIRNGKKLSSLLPQLLPSIHTQQMNQQQILAQVDNMLSTISNQKNDNIHQLIENQNSNQSQQQQGQELSQGLQQQEDEQQQQDQNFIQEVSGEQQYEQDEKYLDLDQPLESGEEDVGLYGQELDSQEMESYENERMGEQEGEEDYGYPQQEMKNEEDQQEDYVNDEFDHFREVEMQQQNQQEVEPAVKSDLQKQIQKLEQRIVDPKEWMLKGEVKAHQRPQNSLLDYDLQFKSGIKIGQQPTLVYNESIDTLIKQRILDQLFDDRVRYTAHNIKQHYGKLEEVSRQKSKKGLAQLYELQFKNYLGLGQDKKDRQKGQILESFKEVNYYLDSLSNFHFTPKPTREITKQQLSFGIEEKTPISVINNTQDKDYIPKKFESEKEQDKGAKRLKNKRIARQRRKQMTRKKNNKLIEYGGITKYESKAKQKVLQNAKINTKEMKYNKSQSFFKDLSKEQSKKPAKDISKARI